MAMVVMRVTAVRQGQPDSGSVPDPSWIRPGFFSRDQLLQNSAITSVKNRVLRGGFGTINLVLL